MDFRYFFLMYSTDQYRLRNEERVGLSANGQVIKNEDVSAVRDQRRFSPFTLVAEIARYLNRSCLEIERILRSSAEGMDAIVTQVNEFNEILYDWVPPVS